MKRRLQRKADGVPSKIRFTIKENEIIQSFADTELQGESKTIGRIASWEPLAAKWAGREMTGVKLRDRYNRMKKGGQDKASGVSCVYIIGLLSSVHDTVDTCTQVYVGETKNHENRLREHNADIKGGALETTTRVLKARQTFPGARWVPLLEVHGFEFDQKNRLALSLESKLLHEINARGMAIRRKNWQVRRQWGDPYVVRSDPYDREATLSHFNVAYDAWKHQSKKNKFIGNRRDTYVDWHTGVHQ